MKNNLSIYYNTSLIAPTLVGADEGITKDKLIQMENAQYEKGRINWSRWDDIVQMTRKDIQEAVEKAKEQKCKPHNRIKVKPAPKIKVRAKPQSRRFVYNKHGDLMIDDVTSEIAKMFNMKPEQVVYVANVPHFMPSRQIFISNYLETKESVYNQIQEKLKNGRHKRKNED